MQHDNTAAHPLLVIVGMAGSGKSSAARHLEARGWRIIRFGGITMRELEARGMEIGEANEKAVREELRETHGMAAYARLSLPIISESLAAGPTIIDGLYSWSEYKSLKEEFGARMKVIAIVTTRSVRYARLSQRADRPLTLDEAESRDIAEIENVEKGGPIAMADHTIMNDGAPEEMLRALDLIVSQWLPGRDEAPSGWAA